MSVKCFFFTPSGCMNRYLRRLNLNEQGEGMCAVMPGKTSYHQRMNFLDKVGVTHDERGCIVDNYGVPDRADPLWPRQCLCGYQFKSSDQRQVFTYEIYRRADTGEEMELKDAPPGAMWYADWNPAEWKGADGHSLYVRCPDGHDWNIDGPCNNCTRKDDKAHRCWLRHGTPPNITVDKNGGLTCSAGAGSIQTPNYHGFLRNGVFT